MTTTLTNLKYSQSKIYKIVNGLNNLIYIGSTSKQYLSSRLTEHLSLSRKESLTCKFYTAIRELGKENFSVQLIKDFPCNSRRELETEEYKIIQEHLQKGQGLYNMNVEQGKYSEQTRQKMRIPHVRKAPKHGSVSYNKTNRRWYFMWRENGKTLNKTFSVKDYGDDGAKQMAEAERKLMYPPIANPIPTQP